MGVWQWLILLAGILAVVGMVLYARRSDPPGPWGHGQQAPDLDDIPPMPPSAPGSTSERSEPVVSKTAQSAPAEEGNGPQLEEPPLPVLLYLVASEGQQLHGEKIHAALAAVKLRHGMQDFYHRTVEVGGTPEPVFSVANMLKPGTLDPLDASQLRTKGLVFFMNVPNPNGGLRAFRDMLETAHHLAEELGAELLDERRAPLTDARIQTLLQDIARRDPPERSQVNTRRRG